MRGSNVRPGSEAYPPVAPAPAQRHSLQFTSFSTSRRVRLLIAFSGVLCLGLGVLLLFRSYSVGTGFLIQGKSPQLLDVAEIARAGVIYQIASPFLWLGVILIILSAAATLFGQNPPPSQAVTPPPLAPFKRVQPRKEKLWN